DVVQGDGLVLRRGVEQLFVAALEHGVFTERGRLAVDGGQASPEVRERLVARPGQLRGADALAHHAGELARERRFGGRQVALRRQGQEEPDQARVEALVRVAVDRDREALFL